MHSLAELTMELVPMTTLTSFSSLQGSLQYMHWKVWNSLDLSKICSKTFAKGVSIWKKNLSPKLYRNSGSHPLIPSDWWNSWNVMASSTIMAAFTFQTFPTFAKG